ncbi:MAG TPA: ATP-binding cassette domain-containing protein [Acidimicrobiales bacterium]|nr:ATP-binding cassette domain-containing protein [Acidimicrobiales bacterium]
MSVVADTRPLLRCADITVRFGGVVAVDSVSVDLAEHEVLGLVGPNGSGKTTLLNAVSGLVDARGRVEVSGTPIPLGRPGAIVDHGVFRTYQTPQVDRSLTCMENVLVASPNAACRGPVGAWIRRRAMWKHEHERWDEAADSLRRVGLLDRANDLAAGLPYGQQRHLEIARALTARPTLLLMDEPAAGLSSTETRHLIELLAQLQDDGITLLVIEHKITFLEEICHRIVVLEMGRTIAEGTPSEVWANPAVMAAYLGEAK